MLTAIHPKLPMRDKNVTINFYINSLGFSIFGKADYPDYLMVEKDGFQIHFFSFKDINPKENYGQIYIRVSNINNYYKSLLNNNVAIHPNGSLERKPWGQTEFSLLDPDNNLLTFGDSL